MIETSPFLVDQLLKRSKNDSVEAAAFLETKNLSKKKLENLKKRVFGAWARPKRQENAFHAVDRVLSKKIAKEAEQAEKYRQHNQKITEQDRAIKDGKSPYKVTDRLEPQPETDKKFHFTPSSIGPIESAYPIDVAEADREARKAKEEGREPRELKTRDNTLYQFPSLLNEYGEILEDSRLLAQLTNTGEFDIEEAKKLNQALIKLDNERAKRVYFQSPAAKLKSRLEFYGLNPGKKVEIHSLIKMTNYQINKIKENLEQKLREATMPDSKQTKQDVVNNFINSSEEITFGYIPNLEIDTAHSLILDITGNTLDNIQKNEPWNAKYNFIKNYPTKIPGLYISIDDHERGFHVSFSILNQNDIDKDARKAFTADVLNRMEPDLKSGVTIK